MDRFTVGRILLAVLSVVAILTVLVPLFSPYGVFIGLDGSPGMIDHAWSSFDPVSAFVYGLGDIFCHQDYSRSFVLNGNQLAFCYRDTAILFGTVAGLVLTDRRFNPFDLCDAGILATGLIFVAIGVVAWAVENVLSADVIPLRLITGATAGMGIALTIQHFVSVQYRDIVEK